MAASWQRNLSAEATTPDRFPSESIWASFPMDEHLSFPGRYFHYFDDFDICPSLTSATTAVNRFPYMSFIDTSDTIVTLATQKNDGVLRLATAATDNNGPVVGFAGTTTGEGACFNISDTAGDDKPLWYEARWRTDTVTDNGGALFIGLAEEARCVNNGLSIDDTGVIADIDHIAFNTAHDDGDALNFAYTKSGQTDTEVIAALDALVASTWYKSGFKYDPLAETAKRIAIFQNQVEQSTYVTGTNIAAATFPDAEELTPYFGVKNGSGAIVLFDIDWFRVAQKKRDT